MKVHDIIRKHDINIGLQPWQLDILAHEALMAEVEETEVDMEGYGPSGHPANEDFYDKFDYDEGDEYRSSKHWEGDEI